jgi:hypothetical protein
LNCLEIYAVAITIRLKTAGIAALRQHAGITGEAHE